MDLCLIPYILAPNNLTKNNSELMGNYGQMMRIIEWTQFECVSYTWVDRCCWGIFRGESVANLTLENEIQVKSKFTSCSNAMGANLSVCSMRNEDVTLLCNAKSETDALFINEMGCNYRVAEETNKHAIESAHHHFLAEIAMPRQRSIFWLTDVPSRRKWLHIAWANDRNYCLSYVPQFVPIVDCNLEAFRVFLWK